MSDDGTDFGEYDEVNITLRLSLPSSEPAAAVLQPRSQVQEATRRTSISRLSVAVFVPPLAASAASFPSAPRVHNHIHHASPVTTVSGAASSSMARPPTREPITIRPPLRLRSRRDPHQRPHGGRGETIEPPFPWATNRRAVVHGKTYLLANGIKTISGEVQCKMCKHRRTLAYDLEEKYLEVAQFIAGNKHQMHDRAPQQWTKPTFPSCAECNRNNCLRPVVGPKKRAINWLFLLLGQTLGCCNLVQLKYFCKHTGNHRTGAKDRLLYITFLGVCKQLEPIEIYDCDR